MVLNCHVWDMPGVTQLKRVQLQLTASRVCSVTVWYEQLNDNGLSELKFWTQMPRIFPTNLSLWIVLNVRCLLESPCSQYHFPKAILSGLKLMGWITLSQQLFYPKFQKFWGLKLESLPTIYRKGPCIIWC